jgi:hypothetical protein
VSGFFIYLPEFLFVPVFLACPKTPKISKAPDGQGPLLTNYKPKL